MSELAKQLRGETVTRLPLEDEPGEPLIGPIGFGAFANPMFEAVLRKFGLCRICFRDLALSGMIPGVRKASW